MKNTISQLRTRLGLLTFFFLLGTTFAFAQTPDDRLSGKYEGVVKAATAGGADERISLELKREGGKITGRLMQGSTGYDVTEGTLTGEGLSLSFGKDAVLTAKVEGDSLVGAWGMGSQKRPLELKKVMAVAAAVDLNGQWDAVADANGQPFPFLLVLKVEGENVSGSSSSQLGESVVKLGSWKNSKLIFQLEGQNGTISMSALVIEGKLSGEFDYSGQLQGKWVAVKRTE